MPEYYAIYLNREPIAAIELNPVEGDDLWSAIQRDYPAAYDVLEDGMDAVIGVEYCTEEKARRLGVVSDGEVMEIWKNLAYVTMTTGEATDPSRSIVCETEAEARELAESMWDDMDGEDRAKYMNRTKGAMFVIEAMRDNAVEIVADWSDLLPKVDREALEVLVDDCLAQEDSDNVVRLAYDVAEYVEWLDWWFGPACRYHALPDLQACGYTDMHDAYDDILALIRGEVE